EYSLYNRNIIHLSNNNTVNKNPYRIQSQIRSPLASLECRGFDPIPSVRTSHKYLTGTWIRRRKNWQPAASSLNTRRSLSPRTERRRDRITKDSRIGTKARFHKTALCAGRTILPSHRIRWPAECKQECP